MTKKLTCPVCGVEFEPFLKRQTCCSVEHQAQRRKELSKLYTGRYRARHRRPDDLDWANARIEAMKTEIEDLLTNAAPRADLEKEIRRSRHLEQELEAARKDMRAMAEERQKNEEPKLAAKPAPALRTPTPEEPGYDLRCEECGMVFWSRTRDERYCCADCLLRAKKRQIKEDRGYPAKKKRRAA